MVERGGGGGHENEVKVRCFDEKKGKPFNKKYDEWIAFDDTERLRAVGGGSSPEAAEAPVEGLPPPPKPSGGGGGGDGRQLPELWLALVARFEAVGGLSTVGIFRVSADNDALDEAEGELFDPSDDADADTAKANEILTPLLDPHVRAPHPVNPAGWPRVRCWPPVSHRRPSCSASFARVSSHTRVLCVG